MKESRASNFELGLVYHERNHQSDEVEKLSLDKVKKLVDWKITKLVVIFVPHFHLLVYSITDYYDIFGVQYCIEKHNQNQR